LGLTQEDLPGPLRAVAQPENRPFAFKQFPLTPAMAAAARAVLATPVNIRRHSIYGQAKAVELMCLLIDLMDSGEQKSRGLIDGRQEGRLYEARDLISRSYADSITLEQISKQVGLNRMALTSGFRSLFGMSVYDYLQKLRMERAYELLQEQGHAISRVAEAVGYAHACNFSTAFQNYFGCSPQKSRNSRRR
jgi:AraC family transcriptional activator of pyochelin receptor